MSTTLIIVVITCIVSFLGFNNPRLINALIFSPQAIGSDRQYYRFVTHGFIHANVPHLFVNMFTLYSFGTTMEQLYNGYLGPFGFVFFYLGGIVAAIVPTYLSNRNNPRYRSLGASGAISAVLFAFILLQPWAMLGLFAIVPVPAIVFAVLYTAYSIYMEKQQSGNVNHSAHLWGAAYGIVFTIAMEPRVIGVFIDQLSHPHFNL